MSFCFSLLSIRHCTFECAVHIAFIAVPYRTSSRGSDYQAAILCLWLIGISFFLCMRMQEFKFPLCHPPLTNPFFLSFCQNHFLQSANIAPSCLEIRNLFLFPISPRFLLSPHLDFSPCSPSVFSYRPLLFSGGCPRGLPPASLIH